MNARPLGALLGLAFIVFSNASPAADISPGNDVGGGVAGQVVSASPFPGDSLSGKTVSIGVRGVKGRDLRSGWVNIDMEPQTIVNLLPDKPAAIELRGVTFWVNDDGANWLSFSIAGAKLNQQDVSVVSGIEKVGNDGGQPYMILDGKYKLVATLENLNSLSLRPVAMASEHANATPPHAKLTSHRHRKAG